MKSKGYTLWLIPKGVNYDKFSDLIKRLAKEYGGPTFEPHITLLGEIILPEEEVIKKVKTLVSGQKPFTIKLEKIDYEDYFFRTLFVRAKITESLQALHNKAKAIVGMENIPPYMPHLSLLYGTFPNEIKEQIIAAIGRDQTAQFDVSSVHLIKGGEVKEWKIIGEFPWE